MNQMRRSGAPLSSYLSSALAPALAAALVFALLLTLTSTADAQASSPTPSPNPATSASAPSTISPQPTTGAPSASGSVSKPARKIYTGWIPYYSVRASVARSIAYRDDGRSLTILVFINKFKNNQESIHLGESLFENG